MRKKDNRISVRIDDELAYMMLFMMQRLDLTQSEFIRIAIHSLFIRHEQERKKQEKKAIQTIFVDEK